MVKRGILKAFSSGTYRADVQVSGSIVSWLKNAPVARGIPSAEMVLGREVLILFDEVGEAMVVAVY
ncbi:MAG: hypothetical protein V1849_04700 [Chloroflexota bacterium]